MQLEFKLRSTREKRMPIVLYITATYYSNILQQHIIVIYYNHSILNCLNLKLKCYLPLSPLNSFTLSTDVYVTKMCLTNSNGLHDTQKFIP